MSKKAQTCQYIIDIMFQLIWTPPPLSAQEGNTHFDFVLFLRRTDIIVNYCLKLQNSLPPPHHHYKSLVRKFTYYVCAMHEYNHTSCIFATKYPEWPYFLFMPHSQKSYVGILTSRSLNRIAHLDFCKFQQNMQYSQTFQFLLFTKHHQKFCLSAFCSFVHL